MKIIVEIPDDTVILHVHGLAYSGIIADRRYTEDQLQAMIVKEPDTIYELPKAEIMRVYHANYYTHPRPIGCEIKRGQCLFEEGDLL